MTTGSESPRSISITGYYKGYSVIITSRDLDVSLAGLVAEAEQGVNAMVANLDWKPSWNAQTNKDLVDPEWIKPEQKFDENGECSHVNFTVKVSSGFKKPENKGKKYKLCDDCGKFAGWA